MCAYVELSMRTWKVYRQLTVSLKPLYAVGLQELEAQEPILLWQPPVWVQAAARRLPGGVPRPMEAMKVAKVWAYRPALASEAIPACPSPLAPPSPSHLCFVH
ncbi:hypothetical protein PLEOSDRAFT_1072279 [Pleurotus ostreatus PC15]|uniref:Uncharacterized protein n=1 Tax=Pleurotus ostreatus (strain PC15) TaxID=1137138 RepID=A0A067NCF3_PLEO1|nr:hypothetical protein PLEOSDRAFT_1072279 [Pleurotus ostreatus PC15]